MKIGILSFHASHNFGSMLQNYALQQFLMEEGHDVTTINLRNEQQKYMYNHPLRRGRTNPRLKTIIGRFRDLHWLTSECKRWRIFETFLKDNLNLTKEYHDWDSIRADLANQGFDTIIAGSDQIWNTFCYDFDWSYFLPGDIRPIRKVAIAPSLGNTLKKTTTDHFLISMLKDYLGEFDFVSVREEDASHYLRTLLGHDVPVIADPTLIVDPSVYSRLIKEPIIKEPYIYYYTPSHVPDIEAEEMAANLAEKLGLKIITSYPHFMRKSRMTSAVSGPAEFLNLLSNSQMTIGGSYHLVIFSILFHKPFITIKRKNDSRINTLLNQLNIKGRNMESVDDYPLLEETDYSAAGRALSLLREESIRSIRFAIGTARKQ